jgi:hypothetical protein
MKKVMLMAVVLVIFAGLAQAVPVVPEGQYRLVFITSTNLGVPAAWNCATSMDGVNTYVQSLATAAGLPGVAWTAIASTSYLDARDNTGTNPLVDGVGVPIYLVDGLTKVADDNADLWDGSVDHIINQNEFGITKGAWPHTGTYLDGTVSNPATEPTNGRGFDDPSWVAQGNGGVVTEWIWRTWTQRPPLISQDPKSANPVYAMSEILPEPATMSLLAIGGLTLLRRRRNG